MTRHKILNSGGDPRTLPDYAALRDELSKLIHPARPDVNWRYAEKLCLSLFEQNGVVNAKLYDRFSPFLMSAI